jgi:hypothetical protein
LEVRPLLHETPPIFRKSRSDLPDYLNLIFNIQLIVNGVTDLAGNVQTGDSVAFIYSVSQVVEPFSVLINEIMADVNPEPNNLPVADYLELYNPGDAPVNLKDCTLQPRLSATPIEMPDVTIWPDSFLIIVLPADTSLFSPFGQVIGLSGFSLNNEGTAVLRNSEGTLVHSISYTTDWYKDTEKEIGGWSLEQIDPGKPCSGQKNWMASMSLEGRYTRTTQFSRWLYIFKSCGS